MAMQSDGVRQTYGRLTSPVPNLSKGEDMEEVIDYGNGVKWFFDNYPVFYQFIKDFYGRWVWQDVPQTTFWG
jgi:hypothetical protein